MHVSNVRPITKFRVLVIVILTLLLLPVAVAGITQVDQIKSNTASERRMTIPTENVTFVTAQGKEFNSNQARLVAFDRDGQPVWVHGKYSRYYDIDPLGNGRILFVASAMNVEDSKFSGNFITVIMNWRTGEVYDRFKVPFDTHDVDYLGDGEYAVADKFHDTVFVYNRTRDEVVWKFDFHKHFPPYPIAGEGNQTQYTHMNDIDAVNNGSAFLVSPRNFDRVMLINRSTKAVVWTLGEEDNYEILHEQHNPVLLSQDPVTVLVADSENNRVVEYRRTDEGWKQDWVYKGNLDWPRDADRLPNGNTMITDSNGDRALIVTPTGEIVWEVHIEFGPYDIERPEFGDEPAGPTMYELGYTNVTIERESDTSLLPPTGKRIVESFEFMYDMSQWVIPSWIGQMEFLSILFIPMVIFSWAGVEISHSSRFHAAIQQSRHVTTPLRTHSRPIQILLSGICLLFGVILLIVSLAPRNSTTLTLSLSALLLIEGVNFFQSDRIIRKFDIQVERVRTVVRVALALVGTVAVILLFTRARQASGVNTEIYTGIAVLLFVGILRPYISLSNQ
jgi:hypothetical protein